MNEQTKFRREGFRHGAGDVAISILLEGTARSRNLPLGELRPVREKGKAVMLKAGDSRRQEGSIGAGEHGR